MAWQGRTCGEEGRLYNPKQAVQDLHSTAGIRALQRMPAHGSLLHSVSRQACELENSTDVCLTSMPAAVWHILRGSEVLCNVQKDLMALLTLLLGPSSAMYL